jgi:hypothetical protein
MNHSWHFFITCLYNAEWKAKCFLAVEVVGWLERARLFGHSPTGSDLWRDTVRELLSGCFLVSHSFRLDYHWKPKAFGLFPHILETCNTKEAGTSTFLPCWAVFPGLICWGLWCVVSTANFWLRMDPNVGFGKTRPFFDCVWYFWLIFLAVRLFKMQIFTESQIGVFEVLWGFFLIY